MSVMQWLEDNILFTLVALVLAFGMYSTIGLAFQTSVPVVAVTSQSMVPTFDRGDMVMVRGKNFSEIQEGEIIVFEHQCMPVPVIHRVIDTHDNTVDAKGDANPSQVAFCVPPDDGMRCAQARGTSCPNSYTYENIEEGITADRVLGVEWFIIPEIGHLKLYPTCLYYQYVVGLEDPGLVCGGGTP